MEREYYPVNNKKKTLVATTALLFIASLVIMNPIADAFLSFSSLITLMIHFNVFESTRDTNKLNKFDLGLQIVFVVVSLIKFAVFSGNMH